jgi:hypothetical protein
VRARPQRIVIERGELRAELDPTNIPPDVAGAISRLLDETRPPTTDDEPGDAAYDLVLDYGDRQERLRYDEKELPDDIRDSLDARLNQP